jgi:hypothetical protein
MYIQSIGSGLSSFSVLFNNFLFTKSSIGLEEISLLLLSLVPVAPYEDKPCDGKPSRLLTKAGKEALRVPSNLNEILVGLLLGDLYIEKRNINPRLVFRQGIVHQDYLLNLYELFKEFCSLGPKIVSPMPHKRTGKVYPAVWFKTMSLPCFNELHDLFYHDGKNRSPPL